LHKAISVVRGLLDHLGLRDNPLQNISPAQATFSRKPAALSGSF